MQCAFPGVCVAIGLGLCLCMLCVATQCVVVWLQRIDVW